MVKVAAEANAAGARSGRTGEAAEHAPQLRGQDRVPTATPRRSRRPRRRTMRRRPGSTRAPRRSPISRPRSRASARCHGSTLAVTLTLLVVLVGLLGVFFTHKVAGPIHRMRSLFKEVGDGGVHAVARDDSQGRRAAGVLRRVFPDGPAPSQPSEDASSTGSTRPSSAPRPRGRTPTRSPTCAWRATR